MTRETLVTLDSAGEATEGVVTFNIPRYMFGEGGSQPSLMLQGITGAETVTLWIADGAGWQQVYDENLNAAQLDPTNTKTTITFNTSGLYSVTHTALAANRKLAVSY